MLFIKVEYEVGEVFDVIGMVVKVIYIDGIDKILISLEYEFFGFSLVILGLVIVIVIYNEVIEKFGVVIFDKDVFEIVLVICVLSIFD